MIPYSCAFSRRVNAPGRPSPRCIASMARSRMDAKSGISPVNQVRNAIPRKLTMSMASQYSGERNCGHSTKVLGYGRFQ